MVSFTKIGQLKPKIKYKGNAHLVKRGIHFEALKL